MTIKATGNNLINEFINMGGKVDDEGVLHLPATLGCGYMKLVQPSTTIAMMLLKFELNTPLKIVRERRNNADKMLTFNFRNILPDAPSSRSPSDTAPFFKHLPSVRVSTADTELDIEVPAHVQISNILIRISNGFLEQLVKIDPGYELIKLNILERPTLLYEVDVSAEIRSISAEIFNIQASERLSNFYYRLKAEELIYFFLRDLLKRDEITNYAINRTDLRKIYQVRDTLMLDLSNPPQLVSLAANNSMSVSKMGKLFRQIFGDSIYNYYQKLRMQQAASLLKNGQLSVSEVGYQLGFSNLSHFTRLFEKHYQVKPKKYSKNE